jgi:hypothetical protein
VNDTSNLYLPTEQEYVRAFRLRHAAKLMTAFFVRELNHPERQGCYVAVLNSTGDVIAHSAMGTILADKEPKYAFHSREKPTRIRMHPGHISSFESRKVDEENRIYMYGGGIRFLGAGVLRAWEGWSIGVSGFPEDVDEAIALGAGYLAGVGLEEYTQRVVAISKNSHWDPARTFSMTHGWRLT